MGDIVYSDGTISSAANYNRSKTAVAVIFDPSRKLGVGLKKPVVKTFVASNSTKGYSTNLGTSSSDGSKNFEMAPTIVERRFSKVLKNDQLASYEN